MRKLTCMVLLLVGLDRPVAAQWALADDPLWLKAVVIAALNEALVPGLWVEQEEVFDKEGRLEESKEYVVQLQQDPERDIAVTLVRAAIDGAEATGRVREAFAKEKKDQALEDESDNPFLPRVQRQVAVRRLDQTRQIQGRLCVAFAYEQQTANTVWRGTAWLDAETGAPLALHSAPDAPPQTEPGVVISDLTAVTAYEFTDAGDWYAREVRMDMRVEADILPFITFEGTARTVVTLSEYWRYSF